MSRFCLAMLALCLGAAQAAAGGPLGGFEARAPIELQGAGPYYRLSLPIEVHLAAHFPDLRDLRVLDAQGEAMPFSTIRGQSRTEQAVEQRQVAWFPLYGTPAASDGVPEIRVERRADGTVVSVKGRES